MAPMPPRVASSLLTFAKYSDNDVRSAGILPAVSGASRSRRRAGRMPTPQRARRPRYEKNSSLYFAILSKIAPVNGHYFQLGGARKI